MIVTTIGYILMVIFMYIFLFCDIKYLFYGLIIISGFTSTSIINIPRISLSIQPAHFVGGLFMIKLFYHIVKNKYNKVNLFSKSLLAFVIIAGISLIYPLLFSKNVIVITPNSEIKPLRFTMQNITQYMYLLFGYLIYLSTSNFLLNSKIKFKNIIGIFRLSLTIILFLGIIQLFVPVDIYNNFFRNNYNHMNDGVMGMVRISSVAQEASMLSLYTAPLTLFLLCGIKNSANRKYDITLIVVSFIVAFLNMSSTYFLAMIVFGIMILILLIAKLNKDELLENIKGIYHNKKNIIVFLFVIVAAILLMVIFRDRLVLIFNTLVKKISGQGESGNARQSAFNMTIKVFVSYFITGVGFGSIRSFDLLSTWLAEVGLLGFIPFCIFLFTRVFYLYRKRSKSEYFMIFSLIISVIIILFISVPEPYYIYLWMYFAFGELAYRGLLVVEKQAIY